jgi:hypothetical protein
MPTRKKIQRKRAKFDLQASRFKKPPPKLKALIELVNCFPTDELRFRFLHPNSLRATAEESIRLLLGADVDTDRFLSPHYAMQIMESIETLPSPLKSYVLHGRPKEKETLLDVMAEGTIVKRYLNLWNAQMRLHRIAQLAVEEPKAYSGRSVLWNHPVPLPVHDKIDEHGFVRVSKDLFTEAMDEDDIEAARIRECEACKLIFWAGRITQRGCSPRCGDIIRKRRYRERYKQGFYQGAELTEKEKAALNTQQGKRKAKTGERA